MASYGTRQQWQQPPQQRQYQYDQRPDPRAYQGPPPSQTKPSPRRHDQYNGYTGQQNGYQNGHEGYAQQDYYHDQQSHQQYQHNEQYQEPYAQSQTHGRTYQYDERYQTHGEARQPPVNPHYQQEAQRQPGKPRPPPLQEQRQQPPRERILMQPSSPKSLAWDNPFGAFPPKKKERGHSKHTSLDKGMGGLTPPQGTHPDQRPHTSQGHRKPDDSIPGPSHALHAEPRPLDGPGLLQDGMPLRKAVPPPQGPSRDHGPPRPPVTGLPARPAPQRSATQPTPTQAPTIQPSGPVDPYGYDQPNMPVQNQPQSPPSQQRPRVVRQNTDEGHGRRPQPEAYDQSNYRGVPLYKPTSNPHNHAASFQPSPPSSRQANSDMPNFEAIPNAVDETHMTPSPQLHAQEQPAYAKKSYQAYSALPSVETKRTQPAPPEPSTASPLADFTFNLPPKTDRGPAPLKFSPQQASIPPSMTSPITYDNPPKPPAAAPRYHDPPLSPPVTSPYDQQQSFENRTQPSGQQAPWRQQAQPPASQFPPRGASRPGPQPRSASDAYANLPPSQGSYRDGPEHIPPRPATSQTARGNVDGYNNPSVRNGYEQGYDQRQAYNQNFDQHMPVPRGQYYDEGDPYSSGRYGQEYDPQAPVRRPSPQDSYGPSEPRPQTSGSRHPPPVRSYGERKSLDHGRPDMPPGASAGFGDRPVPYRPGLAATNVKAPSPVAAAAPAPAPIPQQQSLQAPPPQRSNTAPSQDPSGGPAVTVAELNNLRENFKSKPEDWGLGLRFAKRLVEAASVLSSENGRADPKTTAKNRERYILDAHKILKKLVASGSPEAMFYLADCHGQGELGLAPDPKEAFALYQSAAKLNHPQSAYRVAVCCEIGQEEGGGTRRDPMKAVQWYKRAATLGDTAAMYKLGMVLLKGLLGQQKNTREAVSWLKRAAERADKDNPHALHELGLLYESAAPNDHIVRDQRYALSLFQQAADLGYKYSQFRLGSAWEYGLLGCQIDPRQSIAWYTRAAAQGEHQSELALSGWYLTGSEPLLQQSDQEAYLWARKAASSGLAKAEYAMGYFTEVGIGTKTDVEDAKRWYYRAAAQSFPKARERLEELKRGGPKQKRTRVSRTGRSEGDCVVM